MIVISCSASAEEVKKEKEMKEADPRLAVTEDKLYFDSYYEYGWVKKVGEERRLEGPLESSGIGRQDASAKI